MTDHKNTSISLRKRPKQERSTELFSSVLEAAVQVLIKEGIERFTTARVAEKAGVSVGSLYQYFPNKKAILYQLQKDEWRKTSSLLRAILEETQSPPLERLRTLVFKFLISECEEAEIRTALEDAAPFYRDNFDTHEERPLRSRSMQMLIQEILPNASEATQMLVGHLVATTIISVGKHFSERPRTTEEIENYAAAMSDMLCSYLKEVQDRCSDGVSCMDDKDQIIKVHPE